MMVPLLARETSMLVKDAEDGEIPLANVIYVTPANWNIILKEGVMRLLVPGKTILPKPSATALFNSMAEEKGEDAHRCDFVRHRLRWRGGYCGHQGSRWLYLCPRPWSGKI